MQAVTCGGRGRYDKWFNFESWRDFTLDLEDPFDLEEASCREERRWMDRQNKKQAESLKKGEARRINDMIERCHKWDPRIVLYKEQLKNAKKAGKQAKYAERAAAEEAAKKKAAEEAEMQRKQDEEAAVRKKLEKEQKEEAKKKLRQARKALRDAAAAAGLDGACAVKVEDLCAACSVEEKAPISMLRLAEMAELVAKIKVVLCLACLQHVGSCLSPRAYTIAYSPCAPRPTHPVPRGQLWPLVSVYVCMYI